MSSNKTKNKITPTNWSSVFLPAILQTLAWPIAHFVFRVFGKLKIEGKENLKKLPKGIILAANHAHEMDPILMRAILPMISKHSPMFYVARQGSNYSWKGWRKFIYTENFFKAWGAYPTYKGKKDYEISLKNFISLSELKYTICIFPAGIKKIPVEEVIDVKGGVGYLALKNESSVVPVYIGGTLGITWSSLFKFKNKIIVKIGKPILFKKSTETLTPEACKGVGNAIWREIINLYTA